MVKIKIEILIYSYLAVCASMIIFNIVCIFVFKRRDKRTERYKTRFGNRIKEELKKDTVSAEHKRYLSENLRHTKNIISFDKVLEEMYGNNPEKTRRYIDELTPVFLYLTLEYAKKSEMEAAYFPYIISKYKFCKKHRIKIIIDTMLTLVKSPSLYCRENALRALYVMGDCESIITALKIIDTRGLYFHSKLISDGLQDFDENEEKLSSALWSELNTFSEKMQLAILNYFRFSSGSHKERFFQLLKDKNTPTEIVYCAVRYFGRYYYEPAYHYLVNYAKTANESHWEYAAIAASALSNYPGQKTVEILTELLKSRNWHVRYNASQSLIELGTEYPEFAEIFEGDDRYAAEILRYRFEQKRMKEKEAAAANE